MAMDSYGTKGESGKEPAKVGSSKGAYANSTNSMGPAKTPHIQGWPGYDGSRNQRGGGFPSNVGKDSGSGGDY